MKKVIAIVDAERVEILKPIADKIKEETGQNYEIRYFKVIEK